MKKLAVAILLALVAVATLVGVGCERDQATQLREESVDSRTAMMARAEALYPMPMTQNFPMRALLVEYTERCDQVNHPWYTYIMSDTGAITHYFVSTTIPVSTNAFLGSTEDVRGDRHGNLILTAPSLDGIYYGGGGSITASNGWIFIDAATGAMGVVYGCNVMTYEAPLILETEPVLITIRANG
jgi:hypothetical protein